MGKRGETVRGNPFSLPDGWRNCAFRSGSKIKKLPSGKRTEKKNDESGVYYKAKGRGGKKGKGKPLRRRYRKVPWKRVFYTNRCGETRNKNRATDKKKKVSLGGGEGEI